VKLEAIDNTENKVVMQVEGLDYVGETVWLGFRPEIIHLFDKEAPLSYECTE
jgi:hypothetical protein